MIKSKSSLFQTQSKRDAYYWLNMLRIWTCFPICVWFNIRWLVRVLKETHGHWVCPCGVTYRSTAFMYHVFPQLFKTKGFMFSSDFKLFNRLNTEKMMVIKTPALHQRLCRPAFRLTVGLWIVWQQTSIGCFQSGYSVRHQRRFYT